MLNLIVRLMRLITFFTTFLSNKLRDMDLLKQMGGDPEQSQLADEDFTVESWELRPEGLAQVVLLLFFCFHL